MSTNKYQKFYESRYGNKTKSKSQLETNQNSINNLSARLAASGVNPNEAIDTRNWLEKSLNLRQDQNFIFDIFELINRPQQALFGGIENWQKGGDFLEGLKQGITGNKDTRFKDILMNTGEFDDEKGKINLVDVLGFAGDVFLDPMDLPLIPVSAASKGAKALDTVSDVARAADKATDVAKAVDKAGDIAKAANVVDTAGDVAKGIEFISPTQALGRGAKGLLKKGASTADTVLEKTLEKIDKAKGIEYGNVGSKWASELERVGEGAGKLETYKAIKNNLTTMFDTKLSKTARQTQKLNDAKEYMTRLALENKADEMYKALDATVEELGKKGIVKTAEEVDKDMAKIIDTVKELPMSKVIDGAKDGTIKYTDDIYKKLISIAGDVPDDTEKLINGIKKGKNGVLELSEDWDKVFSKFDTGKLSEKVERASFLTQKEQKEIGDLIKFYEENAPETLEKFKSFYNDANTLVEDQFKSVKGLSQKYLEGNIEGFSKHKMADDYAENVRKLHDVYGVDLKQIENQLPTNTQGIGTGTKTLNARKYNMSAQEANILKKRELLEIPGLSKEAKDFIKNDINLFDTTATSGIQEYINQMPKLAKNTQTVDEVLMKQGFGDLEKISQLKIDIKNGKNVAENTAELNKLLDNSPFRLVEGGKTPYGFKKIEGTTKESLVNFLKSTGNKTGNDELVKMANQLSRLDNMAVDPTVLNIIKFNTNTMNKSEFGKAYNKLLNFFKKNSTASLTNQMNNITGNMSNMAMAGMGMGDISTYSAKALQDLNSYEDILKRGITDLSQLTDDELRVYNNLKGFMENVSTPDKATILRKYDIDGIMKDIDTKGNKNLYDKYVNFFATLNASEDRMFKYATYSYALDNPKFMRNLGIDIADNASAAAKAKAAGEAVNKVLFDPSDLTAFEKGTMKNIIPFYTFTKKNIAYQISNMGDNLQNYNKLMKSYNSVLKSFDGNEENISAYLKDNMYIPLPGVDENGNYKFLRAQLPFGDLVDLTSNPLESIVNRSNPFIKTPYEIVGNKNLLTGQDIESFPGQKGNISILGDIPVLNRAKNQQLISNLTGLGTQFRMLDRSVQGYQNNGIPGIFTNNLTMTNNIDTDKLSRSYEQIENLQNLMKQYEQKGYQFSTMSELKKANKNNTVAGLDTLFAKYGIETHTGGYNTGNKYYDYFMNNRK